MMMMMMMMITEMGNHKRRGHEYHHGSITSFMHTNLQTEGCSVKKLKSSGAPSISNPKEIMKKDKMGERVAALQHLVSPFGKTDTASVLEEASGYIKFLHDQLQVLSAPYIRARAGLGGSMQDEEQRSLRRQGLCLMPIASTLRIARSNGADLWVPANAAASSKGL